MYYDVFKRLCEERGVRPSDVSKATGISTATLTNWKQGKYTPKEDKMKLNVICYFIQCLCGSVKIEVTI